MSPSPQNERTTVPPPAKAGHAWVLFTPVDLVREIYAREARGDPGGALALLAEEVEITQAGEMPWSGRYLGHDGARRLFRLIGRYTAAKWEPLTYVYAGVEIAVAGKLRGVGRGTGRAIETDFVHVWTVARGKAVRCVAFVDTPTLRLALGLA